MYIVQTKLYRFGIVVSFATGKFVDVFLPQFSVFFFLRSATQRRVVETYMLIKVNLVRLPFLLCWQFVRLHL